MKTNKKTNRSIEYQVEQPRLQHKATAKAYNRQAAIKSKWTAMSAQYQIEGGICANIAIHLVFSKKTKTFSFSDNVTNYDSIETFALYQTISSSLALYRLIALLEAKIDTIEDAYKDIWETTIKHKSGKIIRFGESKGSFSFWLPETSVSELSKTFQKDLIELLNHLVSNELMHSYDGLIAGSVA